MEKIKRKQSDMPIHTFKPDKNMKFRYLFFVGIATLLFGILSWGILQPTSDAQWLLLFIIPLYAYIAWYSFLGITQKLNVYEAGIEHVYGSRHSFLRWNDMLRFEWRSRGKSSEVGVVSGVPIHDEIAGASIYSRLLARQDKYFISLSEIFDMPTQADGWFRRDIDVNALRATKFGQIVYDYAPHLFDEKGKNQ